MDKVGRITFGPPMVSATQLNARSPRPTSLTWLKDIPIWEWIIPDGGCLDIDNCPDCWERNAHLERYGFACEVFQKSHLLDFGCGIGYGTEMLVNAGNTVTGVDASDTALTIARERRGKYAQYVKPEAIWSEAKFLGIVTFEVIEHLDNPEEFLSWAAARCKHIVISTPIVPTMKNNPHHKHDFTQSQFRGMVDKLFRIQSEWVQIRPWKLEPSYMVMHGATR
jgi:2-polyprenyl-3-methyl-5-hydroxy-6-metoxy-1,4-benzoquinol methylase